MVALYSLHKVKRDDITKNAEKRNWSKKLATFGSLFYFKKRLLKCNLLHSLPVTFGKLVPLPSYLVP